MFSVRSKSGYKEENIPGPDSAVNLRISRLSKPTGKFTIEEFRIDHENSNAYTAWQGMGQPQTPSPEQFSVLELAGKLKLTAPATPVKTEGGTIERQIELPRQGLILLRVKW